MSLDGIEYSSHNDEMEPPEAVPTAELIKTQMITLSTKQKNSLKARQLRLLKILYDCDNGIHWSDLNDKAKFQQLEKFSGGFAEVLVLKMKDNGRVIVVKKNCKGNNVTANTANEIKLMRLVDSKYVIKFYGISVYDEESDNVAIIMEHGGDRLDAFLDSFPKTDKKTEKLRKILEGVLFQTAKGMRSIHRAGIMHSKGWQRLIYFVLLLIKSKIFLTKN